MSIRVSKRSLYVGIVAAFLLIVGGIILLSIVGQSTPAAPATNRPEQQSPVAGPTRPSIQTVSPSAQPTLLVTPTRPVASSTPTFPPLPATQLTIPATYAPTALPPEVVIEQTSTGPGISVSFDLAEGLYRVVFETGGSAETVIPVVEEGACSTYPLFSDISGPFAGSASYRSTGCRVHFEINGATGEWAIRVEAATVGGVLSVPQEFSGNNPLTTSPLDMPEGAYRLVLETDSPYTLVVPVVIGGLCLERPIFAVNQPGRYEADYLSTGCMIVWQIADVTAAWSLLIDHK